MDIEKYRLLHQKVELLIQNYRQLEQENQSLNAKIISYEEKIAALESQLSYTKRDDGEIERTIYQTLETLNQFEVETHGNETRQYVNEVNSES